MECTRTYDIDENRDGGIVDIKSMVGRAQSEAMMAKTMADSLLHLGRQGNEEHVNTQGNIGGETT